MIPHLPYSPLLLFPGIIHIRLRKWLHGSLIPVVSNGFNGKLKQRTTGGECLQQRMLTNRFLVLQFRYTLEYPPLVIPQLEMDLAYSDSLHID